ncbi:MAG: Nif3-like dinuclear metal center hexameric protein [Chroococcidiopsidaceae cyanobacterium CP_BM_RX_35]|nr:Nif3-like dinuclear metal center hexameric protein [Chroococcidiopsidaceae cyanobacterium CP_BM_RX_35]
MIYLVDIAQFLDQFFAIHRFGEDPGGVYWSSTGPISRLGLALEPWPQLADWAIAERLDGLFLHRPWKLQSNQLPPDIGVVAYHLAFDERLTLGFNPRLAEAFGMSGIAVLGEKAGRAIGMIGEIPAQSFAKYCCDLNEVFGGQDEACAGGHSEVKRGAVVGAMTDALVREAASRGADIYITGQLRQPAQAAVLETGISVVAVGHRRCEEWGLRALAGVLRERWARLEVVTFH